MEHIERSASDTSEWDHLEGNKTKEWMTDEILDMTKETTMPSNRKDYRILNPAIRNKCRQFKEKWLNEKCETGTK